MAKSTQAKIIRTAEQLLWEKGYDGASLNNIVDAAGISKGGLFHYFPNKRAVTLDVLDKYFDEQILNSFDRHLGSADSTMTLKVGLMNWLEETYGAYANKDFKGGCLFGNFALEVSDQDEIIREALKAKLIIWENQLVSYLRPYASEGKILMDARQFSRLIIAMFQGITMTCKVHRDQIRASRDFQAFAEFIERIIVD